MKSHSGFLSFCLLLAVMLLSSPLHAAFKIDVHINGAENPTLTFGEADAPTRSPHPPFSGMFGVADVCFAGPEDAPEWYDRLAEDVKTANNANQWILVAKSNARLTFKKASDPMPTDLKIVYNDVKTGEKKVTPIVNDLSFSVKTGGVYTITRDDTDAPAENPNQDSNQFIAKGESGTVTITPPDFAPKTLNISFAAGLGVLAYFGEDLTPRGITLKDVDWIIKVEYAGTVDYDWTVEYTELQVTLTPTRNGSNPIVTMTPNRSSAPPIQSTITTLGDDPETQQITNIIDWILQKFGTIDFDQDGEVTMDDAIYLYNFVSGGCDPDAVATDLMSYASRYATEAKAQAALDYFRANLSELYFDGTDESNGVLMDNAIYVYNFVSGSLDPDAVAADLMSYASRYATENLAGIALENMRNTIE